MTWKTKCVCGRRFELRFAQRIDCLLFGCFACLPEKYMDRLAIGNAEAEPPEDFLFTCDECRQAFPRSELVEDDDMGFCKPCYRALAGEAKA